MSMISYAQNAEDVRLSRAFGDQATGFYVDVGAYHPESCSLTKHFYDRGWRGMNLEPSPPSFARIAAARPRDLNLQVGAGPKRGTVTFFEFDALRDGLNTFSAEVAEKHRREGRFYLERVIQVYPLAELLAQHAPEVIDFVNVDVEGFEREVLEGADLARFRPRVLVVESTLPLSRTPSHDTWEALVLGAGYKFAVFDGLNRFYVREEDAALIEALAVPPSTLDEFVPYHYHRELTGLRGEVDELRSTQRRWLVKNAARVDGALRKLAERVLGRDAGKA
jgi:FkbM family methyltransferase